MLRSEVNEILRNGMAFLASHHVVLPPFADWSPDDWATQGGDTDQIVTRKLGWDITDFGHGRFDQLGLLLFTLRNGSPADLGRGKGMLYAEKAMISRRDQVTPMHHHRIKAEDIINRGGATLCIQIYRTDAEGVLDEKSPVTVPRDGLTCTVPAGETLRFAPGESITLMPGIAHSFWAEGGDVYIGEVSTVNDDDSDNYFHGDIGRFPTIEDDEAPLRLLVCDYAAKLAKAA